MPETVPGSLAEALATLQGRLPRVAKDQTASVTSQRTDPAKRLERHRRYNVSAKGQARNRRYEAKRPERRLRWESARNSSPVYRRRDDA